ncbi:UPF0276 protein [Neiella marina]|uniref:UPF0276 protein n=1 Tax=Neiella marina TaxID=508461 RepID=A0A8J2U9D4_9GAMM|nr:DUF692 domain-containing protein [Neiella marina]GGA87380.1 UPF0276 protein [Neiella marina]
MTLNRINGVGLGLRAPHLHQVLRQRPKVDWFEAHSCNYLGFGPARNLLLAIAEHYPISLHGVSLNLGSTDPLDNQYIRTLKMLADDSQALMVSDHICFTALDGHHFHDLLPIPFHPQSLNHLVSRVQHTQDILQRPLLLENATRYFQHPQQTMSGGEFLTQLCQRSGCQLLFDISNAFINDHNGMTLLSELLDELPLEHITELHLGGYRQGPWGLVDTHDTQVSDSVWQLYQQQFRFAGIPLLIEWDSELPELDELLLQYHRAQRQFQQLCLAPTGLV